MNFAFSANYIRNDRWDGLAALSFGLGQALERAGAGVQICMSNTLHAVADAFMAGLGILSPSRRRCGAQIFSGQAFYPLLRGTLVIH